MIPFGEMIKKMKSFDENGHPVRFTVDVVSLDVKKNTGGKYLRYSNVLVSGLKKKEKNSVAKHNDKMEKINHKDPNHWENSTINLFDPLTQEINTIHLRNLTRFNGEKISY